MDPADLERLVEVFSRAGRQALAEHTAQDWSQFCLEFSDWAAAEHTAAHHLSPALHGAHARGDIAGWWFIRKHPCWRLRLHQLRPGTDLDSVLNHLVRAGCLRRWWANVYEPETAAFGGQEGMDAAHQLFCADSSAVLALGTGAHSQLGRRELSLLLCVQFMRSAGLEWYEQGDVWNHVCRERPLPGGSAPPGLRDLAEDVRILLLADTSPHGSMFGPGRALETSAGWVKAFDQAGRRLGAAAREGILERGLRRILAYQVIFHWNRLGLSARAQAAMAWAARAAVLDIPDQGGQVQP
ncbi:thiopeptide-type bacteriocin biosynthesis protein [Nocardiopsis algeriensis]|uniref:Thiopeptide-type bacteriocin biosynthesis protein n=1 Tax=Nocardiopsis algeriensis TaxID=1478215 RepID=A0A841IVA2_9ACTN|nr:thiopeptide-type bacteriocin biosynthesis protein [Nocardiopsis algeriensis]MBB6122264.1 thiopeptide-type bacteriocin biosynthesis protein [Nocardiopsis algeriensis]